MQIEEIGLLVFYQVGRRKAADGQPFCFMLPNMPNLDRAAANALVESVVRQKHSSRNAPIPGSVLKLELMKRAAAEGMAFDEHAIGFQSFLDFMVECPNVSVHRRPGSDFVVLPAGESVAEEELPTPKRPRIRRDVWFGFVSFAVPGTRRIYDRANDRIIYEEESRPVGSSPAITPFSPEQQLVWRKEFVTHLGDEGLPLTAALNSPNPFREFSIIVRRQPKWAREWNSFLLQKVSPVIEAWAEHNNVSKDRWLISEFSREQGPPGRREIYALLDRIPVNRLLDLRVPLGWLLETLNSQEPGKGSNNTP